MNIEISGQPYSVVDTIERITIADSFVVRSNKIGGGNGEAKLYVGQEGETLRSFWGNRPFTAHCFLLKEDLLRYLDDTQVEYLHPQQTYQHTPDLALLWGERKAKIEALPNEIISFEIEEQAQIRGPRIYIKGTTYAFHWLRELSLPNITFISIVRLLDHEHRVHFYFRLFADYFGSSVHPYALQQQDEVYAHADKSVPTEASRARKGQGIFRSKLLAECPFCPITSVSDDRLLIASHIKPWIVCDDLEKIDPKNGLMLTPTFDRLFDQGFLSFTDDKRSILSPFLSKTTYSKLGISDDRLYPMLPTEGREQYLEYHRQRILKR